MPQSEATTGAYEHSLAAKLDKLRFPAVGIAVCSNDNEKSACYTPFAG